MTQRTLEQHDCSEEELGLSPHASEGDSSSFTYPIFSTSYNEVNTWKKKFRCVKKDDLEIWGDYNSAKAQQLAVKFKFCKDRDDCHSEEETRNWLRRKYIVLIYN